MNNELRFRYLQLSARERTALRQRLKDSPKSLQLLDLLQGKGNKPLTTVEVVDVLYAKEDAPFAARRNRFFKLRAELLRQMNADKAVSASGLLPLEEQLLHCRRLTASKQFGLAAENLRKLIATCRHNNIVELLPEALLLLIQCTQSINLLHETERLVAELVEAGEVLTAFRTMQGLNRLTYLHSVRNDTVGIDAHIEQMRRVMLRYPSWHRFRLFYHFTAFNNRVAHIGPHSKSVLHHLNRVKKLVAAHPEMPCMYYEKHGAALLEQYLKNGEATYLYNRGKVQESYHCFRELWIMQERIPDLRTTRSDSYFNNRIAIEMATGHLRDALKTAEAYITFLNEQQNRQRQLMGYVVLTNLYTYAWPQHRAPDPKFLNRQLTAYVHLLKKNGTEDPSNVLATQAIFSFLCSNWKLARTLSSLPEVILYMTATGISFYCNLLALHPRSSAAEFKKVETELRKASKKMHPPQIQFALTRAEEMLRRLRSNQLD